MALVNAREPKAIKEVLRGWGAEVLNQSIEVSLDRSGNYRHLVRKILPEATLVAARFHVMKLVGEEWKQTIIKASKATALSVSETEKATKKSVLHRSNAAMLKPEDKRTAMQKLKLAEVKQPVPVLAARQQPKEAFRKIFEESKDGSEGTFSLLAWLSKIGSNLELSAGTIKRWRSEIIGYFGQGTTSGVVEGIHKRLKLIKRWGYGFRNFERFSLRCLLCWHLNNSSA